ncbi:hypothetical protein ACFQ3L_05905 [Lacticaseibacillus jixianensis]|uniref:Uncharacterized protein n=1 Tax=Lacticaseibacillus jixianensis TaxID=2486012 RepID=A0ABW4BC93_9LACO|nr:hypothetical protein [Lacticaseibacillus jixianensis]
MAETTLSFAQLSDAAKRTAINDFATFYIDQYQHEGLDALAQIDLSGRIADINQWLISNRSFMSQELHDGLVRDREENFAALLEAVNVKFNANGKPAQPWTDWYKETIAAAPQGR